MALLSAPAPAMSAEGGAPQAWGLPDLMRSLAGVRRANARYVERKYLSVLKEPLETSGVLAYVAPNYLRKEAYRPRPELLLVDGDRLTIESAGEQRTLRRGDYPQIWAFIDGIRATLAGDLAQLQAVYTVTLEGDPAGWTLVLQPRDAEMQKIVQRIQIAGSAAHVRSIVTQEGNGDRTEMAIIENTP